MKKPEPIEVCAEEQLAPLQDECRHLQEQLALEKERRLRAESDLRTSDEHYSAALAQGHAAVYRRNFETGVFEFLSDSISQLTGYRPEEFTPALWDESVEQSAFVGELEGVRPELAIQAYRNGQVKTWRSEVLFRTKSGEKRWILDLSTGVRDETGKLIRSMGVLEDISELKASEQRERSLQTRVSEARQMESLGKLAGVVAHELNNILVPVVGYPELIQNDLPPDSPSREYLNLISSAGKKAVAYITDLLALARQESPVFKPVQLNTAIQRYLETPDFAELKTQYANVQLRLQLAPQLPPFSGSYGRMNRILANLLTYFYEIAAPPCHLELSTGEEAAAGGANGRHVVFRLHNPTLELALEELDKIFEPFYIRTRTGSAANGLSLAAVYGLVKEQRGDIRVHSSALRGTEFNIRFPAVAARMDAPSLNRQSLRGTGRILVVDDEQNTRDIATRFLKHLGYEVATAVNGHEAVRLYETAGSGAPFDVILLDMIMERGFDGLDTFTRIKEIHPRQKCIITSGYSESERARQVLALGAGQFLPKPYTLEQIGKAVQVEMSKSDAAVSSDVTKS